MEEDKQGGGRNYTFINEERVLLSQAALLGLENTFCVARDLLESGLEVEMMLRVGVRTWLNSGSPGVLEDGVTSNGVPRSTAPSGISNPEKKMSCGTQCPNPQSLSSGPLAQKQNGLRTAEAKRETKRMSAKEVTINVADSIRQVDRSRRITKNCIN
nr:PREDICTED: brain and acute leukemia cytoplasmic protein [Bos mutus]